MSAAALFTLYHQDVSPVLPLLELERYTKPVGRVSEGSVESHLDFILGVKPHVRRSVVHSAEPAVARAEGEQALSLANTHAMTISVWLDQDPGHDDAIATLLAVSTPGINPVGISTVHGNGSLLHTTRQSSSP